MYFKVASSMDLTIALLVKSVAQKISSPAYLSYVGYVLLHKSNVYLQVSLVTQKKVTKNTTYYTYAIYDLASQFRRDHKFWWVKATFRTVVGPNNPSTYLVILWLKFHFYYNIYINPYTAFPRCVHRTLVHN